MLARQVQPQRISRKIFKQIADHNKVAQGFAHLFSLVVDHGDVEPGADEGSLPTQWLYLGSFALVVWKDQVSAAAVDIDVPVQKFAGNCRAFDVPAGAPRSPWVGHVGSPGA